MIDNYEIITYMTIFLILVYIGKSVNYTKNGIIATIIAAIVIFSLIYFKTPNKKIRNEKYPIIEKNLKLKQYPFLSIEPKFIKIFNYLLGYNKENHTTILRIVKLSNSFFKKYYTIYNHYSKRDYRKIENAIIIKKKILNELSSLIVSSPTNDEYETRIINSIKKTHSILNSYVNKMVTIHNNFWNNNEIDNNYSPIFLEKGPYPNDIETEYYSPNFNLY